jgi:hypothetical protein
LLAAASPVAVVGAIRYDGSYFHHFNGKMMDVRVYNREVTAAEFALISAGLG